MGLSKSNRIIILLCIDTAFFFLELVVGECKLTATTVFYEHWLTDAQDMLYIPLLSLRMPFIWLAKQNPSSNRSRH